jgi:hypothetical protein
MFHLEQDFGEAGNPRRCFQVSEVAFRRSEPAVLRVARILAKCFGQSPNLTQNPIAAPGRRRCLDLEHRSGTVPPSRPLPPRR